MRDLLISNFCWIIVASIAVVVICAIILHDFRNDAQEHVTILPGGVVIVTPASNKKKDLRGSGWALQQINQEPMQNRRLSPKTGTASVLSVLVTSNLGEKANETADNLSGYLFGLGPQASKNTPLTLYSQCSFGALKLHPASVGNNVVNGVVRVETPMALADGSCSLTEGVCQRQIIAATEEALGQSVSSYDFVMFCVPDGVLFRDSSEWTAFAYSGDNRSFFRSGFCSSLTVTAHELGHLMGFKHSNVGTNRYDDETSVMGGSLRTLGGPRYCFNGYTYSLSGWMTDTTETIDITEGAWYGRLVAFVDKENIVDRTDRTLLQVSHRGTVDVADSLFVIYNRAKSFNDGVRELADLVTISRVDENLESNRVGSIDSGEKVEISGVVIELCAKQSDNGLDFATITVYDPTLGQASLCETRVPKQPAPTPPPCPELPTTVSIAEWFAWINCDSHHDRKL
jgi:Gametolysin peptidase M11